jgi:hypothetical protein
VENVRGNRHRMRIKLRIRTCKEKKKNTEIMDGKNPKKGIKMGRYCRQRE